MVVCGAAPQKINSKHGQYQIISEAVTACGTALFSKVVYNRGEIVDKQRKVVEKTEKMWSNDSSFRPILWIQKRKKDDNMKRITFINALETSRMLHQYGGASVTEALREAFQAQSAFNQMIDAGLTDEQIKAVWDHAVRHAELVQSQRLES